MKNQAHTTFIWKQFQEEKIIKNKKWAFTLHAFVITDFIPHLSGLWVVFVQNKLSLIEVVVVSVMKYMPLLFRQENTSQSSINTGASEITLAELNKRSPQEIQETTSVKSDSSGSCPDLGVQWAQ